MGKPFSPPPDLAVVALAVMILVAVLSAMPPFASMALAVLAAVSWCIWLDRHPTP
jgi:flagellar biosynthesis component FlhA